MDTIKRPGGFSYMTSGFIAKRGRLVLATGRNLCDVADLYRPGGDIRIVDITTGMDVDERAILTAARKAASPNLTAHVS